ncbi:MAG: FAD-dependent oxidoreductase [Acidobacteriota bacterium]
MIERPATFDVAILGSGFAGSILARVLARQGKRVLLFEQGRHPRFALGESSTPLASLSLERLAARYRLPDLHHLATYGRWTDHLPYLRRGLKRGFTFFHHRRGQPYRNCPGNEARQMVAASPDDRIADTHWLRADVDQHLVRRAAEEGVTVHEDTRVEGVEITADAVHLTAVRNGEPLQFSAGHVVDATGGAGVLARSLGIPRRTDAMAVDTGLLYCHAQGMRPFAECAPEAHLGDGPYPEEKAAVHHLLDVGWLYALPFDHGVTSVGLVLRNGHPDVDPDALAADPEGGWRRLLEPYPSLWEQLRGARPVVPWRYRRRIQHRLDRAAGRRWFHLPQGFCFVDPLFSTGMAWSLIAVERLASLFEERFGDWRRYDHLLQREADQVERLVEAAYLSMDDFRIFSAVTLAYFGAVSFEEARQRLRPAQVGEPPDPWRGFLGAGDPVIESLFADMGDRLRGSSNPSRDGQSDRDGFTPWILRALSPRDVAGLDRPAAPNLFPVDLDILVERADLLGLRPEAVSAALPRLRGDA